MILVLLCIGGTSAAESFEEFMAMRVAEGQESTEPGQHELKRAILHGIKVLEESFDGAGLTPQFFGYVRYHQNEAFLKTNGINEEDVAVLACRLGQLKTFALSHSLPQTREEYDLELGYYFPVGEPV